MKAICSELVVLLLLCLRPLGTPVFADQAETAASDTEMVPPQIVLLHNGELLRGPVARDGARVVVRTGIGTTIRLWPEEVALVGVGDEDAYRYQLARIDPRDPAGQLQLTRWCLSVPLLERAARHLEIAAALSPQHRDLDVLRQRLSLLRKAPEESPTSQKKVRAVPREPPATPSVAAESLAEFTAHVQPILLNRCGAATCHGRATPSSFSLETASWSHKPRRRVTMQNLQAVLSRLIFCSPTTALF